MYSSSDQRLWRVGRFYYLVKRFVARIVDDPLADRKSDFHKLRHDNLCFLQQQKKEPDVVLCS